MSIVINIVISLLFKCNRLRNVHILKFLTQTIISLLKLILIEYRLVVKIFYLWLLSLILLVVLFILKSIKSTINVETLIRT